MAIVGFLCCGETNVFQENLDSFLATAEELQQKGLIVDADCETTSTTVQGILSYINTALWQSGDMGEKCNKKVVNFGN